MSTKRQPRISSFVGVVFFSLFAVPLLAANVMADSPPWIELDSQEYLNMEACEKKDYLWESRIVPTEYGTMPPLNLAGGWEALLGGPGALLDLGKSFSHVSDEMPRGRRKFIHPFGSVALVEFQADPESPLSGLFSAPNACGLARLSLAGPPAAIGYTPGMALKLFVDGRSSANTHVMHSLNGQGRNHNFFEHTFSNILEPPRGLVLRLLAAWFARFVDDPLRVGLEQFAGWHQDGSETEELIAPYQIYFAPTDEVQMDPDTRRDFREELGEFPVGTILYEVYARVDANDLWAIRVGRLVMTSRFVASQWGDRNLFFQHRE